MTIKSGKSAAKRAEKHAKYLRSINEFQKRQQLLEEARTVFAQSTTQLRSGVTGVGDESSGGQGVLGSINSQANYNFALERHTGETADKLNKEVKSAKKSAANIKLAAIAATVITFGAAAVVGAAAAGGVAAAGAGSTAGGGAVALGGATSFSVGGGFAGASAAASVAGGATAAVTPLAAGITAAKSSLAATKFIRTGANALSNLATNYETIDPASIGGTSIAPINGYYGGGGGSGGGGGRGYSSGSYSNISDRRVSSPRRSVNTSVFYG